MGRAQEPLRIGMVGCGVVGQEVANIVTEHAARLTAQVGRPLELVGIAVQDVSKPRPLLRRPDLLTDDTFGLAKSVDVLVEVAGGTDSMKPVILAALNSQASVVTANKALLAEHGDELFTAADAIGVSLFCEAAAAGAIPLMRVLRDSLSGDRVHRVIGIVNGTTNFILDQMQAHANSYEVALATAQELGYAEADPTADVDGADAVAKAALIARLAFNASIAPQDIPCEGIRGISSQDIEYAQRMGQVIKLLAVCERAPQHDGPDQVAVRVHPALLPVDHPLASVRGAFNAVFVEAEYAGQLMLYGPGAGGKPTASAVVGDLVTAARLTVLGGHVPLVAAPGSAVPSVAASDSLPVRAQVRLVVRDEPGVLATVANSFAQQGISLESVQQRAGVHPGQLDMSSYTCDLVVTTHFTTEGALARTVEALRTKPGVVGISSVLRVVGES